MSETTKESMQEDQYHFPYHHLTHENDGAVYIFRHLFWGLIHYTYIQFVISKIISENFSSLVDIGCGEGRIVCELEQKLPTHNFTGIDISERAIFFAKGFSKRGTFFVHDIVSSSLAQQYDAAISCEVIEHIQPEMIKEYVRNIALSLHEGGKLFLTTPTTNTPTIPKHYQHFTLESLQSYLGPYFSIQEVHYLNKKGFMHSLLSRLIANKIYISNWHLLNKFVTRLYKKNLLVGTRTTGSRIFLVAQKIPSSSKQESK